MSWQALAASEGTVCLVYEGIRRLLQKLLTKVRLELGLR